MLTIRARKDRAFSIGRSGEYGVRRVEFDLRHFETALGAGAVTVLRRRNGDTEAYPAAAVKEGEYWYWYIGAEDTASVGTGEAEVVYIPADGGLAKSERYCFYVADALSESAQDIPEAQQGWVDQVLEAGAKAESAASHPPVIGENGNWYLWDFESGGYVDSGKPSQGSGGSGSVQADWSQNDESAADYVKDRTHYTKDNEQTIEVDLTGDSGLDSSGPYAYVPVEVAQLLADNYENAKLILAGGDAYNCTSGEKVTNSSANLFYLYFDHTVVSIDLDDGEVMLITDPDTGLKGTLVVDCKYEIVYPLDEKYIPDTILRTSALESAVDDALAKAKESGAFDGPAGKDGVIALTGAAVGQIARITAVDDDGVPTAWEPVDFPSGEGEWESITYDFSSEGVTAARFDFPKENITEIFLMVTAISSTGKVAGRIYGDVEAISGNTGWITSWSEMYTAKRTMSVYMRDTGEFGQAFEINFAQIALSNYAHGFTFPKEYLYFGATTTDVTFTGTATMRYR